QQHINKDVIKTLPILLPSMEMQKRAVEQYKEDGTDVITFLKENSKQADEKAIESLVDVMEVEVVKLVGNDTSIEKSAYLLSEISLKALSIEGVIDELSSQKKDWFPSVLNILRVLKDINKIPPGPVLLNILQDVGEQIIQLLKTTAGNYNQEERLLRVFGNIGSRVHRCIDKILANISIVVSSSVSELEKNSDVEFSISLDNYSFLPLKNVEV
ncbi:hypothetical protein CGI53_23540, partial [Vibrio parahaemolyticus]